MKFKIDDKIEIIGTHYLQGMLGTVIRSCGASNNCKIIRFVDGRIRHVFISNLILKPKKNQQLLFEFMD